jgi:hypothetical protein
MRRARRAVAASAVAAIAVVATTACGSDADAGSEPSTESSHEPDGSAAADVSTCKAEATPASTPYGAGFPADWPFPPESVVFNAEDRGEDGTIVTAVSSTDFKSILDFMNHDVVDAGFAIEQGETEEHDAEAEWEGNGFRGRWAIRESAQCEGETVVQVLSTAD